MLLRVVGSCFAKFETCKTFEPTTPNISFYLLIMVLWVVIILSTMHCRSKYCWELLHPSAHHCQHGHNNSKHYWPNNVGSCCIPSHTTASMDTTIPIIADPTMLRVVASLCTPLPAWTQQFQTLSTQQCWELLLQFAVSLTFICNIINPIPGKLSPGWTMQTSAKIVAHYLTL